MSRSRRARKADGQLRGEPAEQLLSRRVARLRAGRRSARAPRRRSPSRSARPSAAAGPAACRSPRGTPPRKPPGSPVPRQAGSNRCSTGPDGKREPPVPGLRAHSGARLVQRRGAGLAGTWPRATITWDRALRRSDPWGAVARRPADAGTTAPRGPLDGAPGERGRAPGTGPLRLRQPRAAHHQRPPGPPGAELAIPVAVLGAVPATLRQPRARHRGQATAAAPGRYAVLGRRAVATLEREYYNGAGEWNMCVPVRCSPTTGTGAPTRSPTCCTCTGCSAGTRRVAPIMNALTATSPDRAQRGERRAAVGLDRGRPRVPGHRQPRQRCARRRRTSATWPATRPGCSRSAPARASCTSAPAAAAPSSRPWRPGPTTSRPRCCCTRSPTGAATWPRRRTSTRRSGSTSCPRASRSTRSMSSTTGPPASRCPRSTSPR